VGLAAPVFQAQQFANGIFIAYFFKAQTELTMQYLRAVGRADRILRRLNSLSIVYTFLTLYITVHIQAKGFQGVVESVIANHFIDLAVVILLERQDSQSFLLPTWGSVKGLFSIYYEGLPLALNVSIEGWSFELQGFLASY
jgi:hypothetical protein